MRLTSFPKLKTTVPGPKSKKLARQLSKYECPQITYIDDDFPIFWEKGSGCIIIDVDGNHYVDFTAAFGVANLGHSNPIIINAAKKQLYKLSHGMGDVHPTELKVKLAQKLAEITPGALSKVIFSSSGSEAVESAIKTALIVSGKPGIISFQGSYHGLTQGALNVTGTKFFKNPFKKHLSKYTVHLPYPDSSTGYVQSLESIKKTVNQRNKGKYPVGALILEPILGRGGVIMPPKGFLKELEKLCREMDILLIIDEIYTGFGRTGKLFAINHEKVIPDILCLGKALANGFPISACIGKKTVMEKWGKSTGEALHTSTFLGNPLGCAMALETIRQYQHTNIISQVQIRGNYLLNRLKEFKKEFNFIGDIRGKGLMLGIELVKSRKQNIPNPGAAVKIVKSALKKGLILLPSGEHGNILCLTPPLIISVKQIDASLSILHSCLVEL